MTKPHEQEWTKDEQQVGRINATEAISLEVRVAFWRVPEGPDAAAQQAQSVLDFALAAPDMARALLTFVNAAPGIEASNWGGEDLLDAARTALRKAGVL